LKGIADDLLVQKYSYERRIGHIAPEVNPLPALTRDHKKNLDSLAGQDESIEDPAFNFDLDKTIGGYQD
jgi:hypothetical protein